MGQPLQSDPFTTVTFMEVLLIIATLVVVRGVSTTVFNRVADFLWSLADKTIYGYGEN